MQSIYERIHANIQAGGELPDEFSFLSENGAFDDETPELNGEADGLFCYRRKTASSQKALAIIEVLKKASSHEFHYAEQLLLHMFADARFTMLHCLDVMYAWIRANMTHLQPLYIYMFARRLLLHTRCPEIVKFALSIIRIFPRQADVEVVQAIREFGAAEEFALFVLLNIKEWKDGNEEVFRLAKILHGWGRIHAVKLLQPETEQIRRWLLHEGVSNTVKPEFSVMTVAEKVDLPKVVKECDGDSEDFRAACGLFQIMMGSKYLGSGNCFSGYAQKEQLVHAFIDKARTTSNEELYSAILIIKNYCEEYLRSNTQCQEFAAAANAILSSDACINYLKCRIPHGESLGIASEIGIECEPRIKEAILENWRDHWKMLLLLENSEDHTDIARIFLADMEGKKLSDTPEIQTWRWLMDNMPRYSEQEERLLIIGLDSPIANDKAKVLKRVRLWKKNGYMTTRLSKAVESWRHHERNWFLVESFHDL